MATNQSGIKGYYEIMPWEGGEIEYEHSFRWEECEDGMGTFDSQVTVTAVSMGFFTNGRTTTADPEEDQPEETHWLLRAAGLLLRLHQ